MDEYVVAIAGGLVLPLVQHLLIPDEDKAKASFDSNQDRVEPGRWPETGVGDGKPPSA